MKRIVFFSGNRAEFGILFPVIVELSKNYQIDILFSGAHVLPEWNTYGDSIRQLDEAGINYVAHKIELPLDGDVYSLSLGVIYASSLEYLKDNSTEYAIVLGDRIESLGFALGAFYSRVPLIHFCGGDVVQVSNYDTNVRHSITKIANYHMVTSEYSKKIIMQLGEEDNRIVNIGNPSFDYERMGFLTPKEELVKKYNIDINEIVGIVTFHPDANKSANENLEDFLSVYEGCIRSSIQKIIVTYPNNDPGHDRIVQFLEKRENNYRVTTIKSLGTYNYLGMMNQFKTILIGNSSSGLLESIYYQTPVLNIGDRQKNRVHGKNVIQCTIDKDEIENKLNEIVQNYDKLKKSYYDDRFMFGDGRAAIKVANYLEEIDNLSKDEKLFKRFVVREMYCD